MLNTDAVHIWRDPEGDYHLQWDASHPATEVTVEPLAPGLETLVHYLPGSRGARCSGMPPGSRHYFRLRDQYGTEALAPERKLGMQGTPNFRDFGGYSTTNGGAVKWGYLYRSGQLSDLSDEDVALLDSLGLDLVCDFRRLEEQESDPSRLPAQNTPKIARLPITPGSNSSFFEQAQRELGDAQAMFDFMVDINRDFVEQQSETYARMFREILAQDDARFLVHCAAGKDRTGFAAAIILLSLGVSQERVMHDYLLTSQFFSPVHEVDRMKQKYQMTQLDSAAVLPMLEVHRDYLARALSSIEQTFPTFEAYLEDALAVGPAELEELRSRYLK